MKLDDRRRDGIESFWRAFFEQTSAHPVAATDGTGLLMSFVKQSNTH
jgi:hypothetical protein